MKLDLHGCEFAHVAAIELERDAGGKIIEELPQSRYKNQQNLALNPYGQGPFCRFRVSGTPAAPGVYALTCDRVVKYVGRCDDLSERWGPRGYGVIHPRNCFQRGQPTNCRVNSLILEHAKRGVRLDLWFRHEIDSENRNSLERELIRALRPEWNRHLF